MNSYFWHPQSQSKAPPFPHGKILVHSTGKYPLHNDADWCGGIMQINALKFLHILAQSYCNIFLKSEPYNSTKSQEFVFLEFINSDLSLPFLNAVSGHIHIFFIKILIQIFFCILYRINESLYKSYLYIWHSIIIYYCWHWRD